LQILPPGVTASYAVKIVKTKIKLTLLYLDSRFGTKCYQVKGFLEEESGGVLVAPLLPPDVLLWRAGSSTQRQNSYLLSRSF